MQRKRTVLPSTGHSADGEGIEISNKIQSTIALTIVIAVFVAVAYFLVPWPLVEAQESTPGLTIGEPECSAFPLFIDEALTGVTGGMMMFLDPSLTISNPVDSNIKFIPTPDFEQSGHMQFTFDVYYFADLGVPGSVISGDTNIHIGSYCQLGEDDLILKYYYWDDDKGDIARTKFP